MRSSRGSHEGAWIWGRQSTLWPAWLPGCGENHFLPRVSDLPSAAELGTATRRKPPRRARRGHAGRAQAGRGARAPGRPSAARLPGAPRLAAGVWAPRPLPALRLCCHLPQLFFPRLACCYGGQALISFVPFSLKKKNHYMFFKLEENSGIRRLESGKQRRAARETAPRPQADDGHCATRPGPRRLCRLEGNTERRRVTLATARARADRRQTRDAPHAAGSPRAVSTSRDVAVPGHRPRPQGLTWAPPTGGSGASPPWGVSCPSGRPAPERQQPRPERLRTRPHAPGGGAARPGPTGCQHR